MSIPVLALPILNRYDLGYQMMDSVDVAVDRFYVIDNGGLWDRRKPDWATEMHICSPGANLGWGPALNLTFKANLKAPWWVFVNSDIIFAKGALEKLEDVMWTAEGPAVGFLVGFSAFAVNDKAIERVGFFDESYHPCYCEDSDWSWRAKLTGEVAFTDIENDSIHVEGGSVTIREDGTSNDRTYLRNKAYHEEKWGGEPWDEKYETPWDSGWDPTRTNAPRLSRLRSLAW